MPYTSYEYVYMNKIYWKQPEIHWHYVENPCQKIEYVKWCDSYSLGIKVIDDQHKKLLDFVNDLSNHAAMDEEEEHHYFREIIMQVVDYIKTHFATEEGIMLATRFPDFTEHVIHHKRFIMNVVRIVKDYEAGKRLALNHFSNFMKNWVLSHIAVVDVKYIEYFKNIAILTSDGNLLL